MKSEELKLILYQALGEPIGLLLQVSDFPRARQALYRARADAQDPTLARLQFRASPGIDGGNLIIVNEKAQLATPNLQLQYSDLGTDSASMVPTKTGENSSEQEIDPATVETSYPDL